MSPKVRPTFLAALLAASLAAGGSDVSRRPAPSAPEQTPAPAAPRAVAVTQTGGAGGAAPGTDACALLTPDEIKQVQGEEVEEAKPSRRARPA